MIKIVKHINVKVEAPYLDAGTKTNGSYPVKYKAFLKLVETGDDRTWPTTDKTNEVSNSVSEVGNEKVVVFTFPCAEIDNFHAGDIFNLVIYEVGHTEAYWRKKMFILEDLDVAAPTTTSN